MFGLRWQLLLLNPSAAKAREELAASAWNDPMVSGGEWTRIEVGESLDTDPQKLNRFRDNTYGRCEPDEPESSLARSFIFP